MEKKYLIMNCCEYGDNTECDPVTLTDNYNKYIKEHRKDYDNFEVYELIDDKFQLIASMDETAEEGMAFYYWTNEEMNSSDLCAPHIIRKWRNSTRKNAIPDIVLKSQNKDIIGYDNSLSNCGYISWYRNNGNYFVYGEYRNNFYVLGY